MKTGIAIDSLYLQNRVKELRSKSKYYPEVIFEEYLSSGWDNYPPNSVKQVFASTLVRIERDGVWYVVHVVEHCLLDQYTLVNTFPIMLNRFLHKVNTVQLFWKPKPEEKDSLQKSEFERLYPSIQ